MDLRGCCFPWACGILFILLLTALMMPVEVIIIPLFYQMKAWHLTDSLRR